MPECDYCGKQVGNAGALKSHEAHCDEKAANATPAEPVQSQQAVAQAPPQQQTPQQAQNVPATRQQAQQSQQGGTLATPDQMNPEALETGAALGNILAGAASGSPEQKAESKSAFLQAIAGGAAQLAQKVEKEEKEAIQNARAAADHASVRQSNDYLTCPSCSEQITKIHNPEGEFACPGCGTMLELVTE